MMPLTGESLDFKFLLTVVKGLIIRILSKMLLKDNMQRLMKTLFCGVVAVAVSQAPYENFTSSFGR